MDEGSELVISPDGGVVLDGMCIPRCTGVDIRIDAGEILGVSIHVDVDKVDVKYP